MSLRSALVFVQGLTFVALGAVFVHEHAWRLAGAQLLLGVVQVLIYL